MRAPILAALLLPAAALAQTPAAGLQEMAIPPPPSWPRPGASAVVSRPTAGPDGGRRRKSGLPIGHGCPGAARRCPGRTRWRFRRTGWWRSTPP